MDEGMSEEMEGTLARDCMRTKGMQDPRLHDMT